MPAGNRPKAAIGIALIALLLLFSGCDSRAQTPRADQRVPPAATDQQPSARPRSRRGRAVLSGGRTGSFKNH